MYKFQIYIGGKFAETHSFLEVKNPYNNELIGQTFLAGEKELELAIKKAQSVQKEYGLFPSYKRYGALMHIAKSIEAEKDEFAKILCLESAKPMKYAKAKLIGPFKHLLLLPKNQNDYQKNTWIWTGHLQEQKKKEL